MYAAHAARSAVHREVNQYEDDNVGTQALSEGEKAAGNVRDISKSRYARKLKKKAKMQGKKGSKTARSSASEPTAAQDAGASSTSEGGSNWLPGGGRNRISGRAIMLPPGRARRPQTAGGKAASNGASAARSGVEQAVEKGKTAVSTAVKGLVNAAKGNAHVLVIVGVFLLLVLMVMSGFSSCGILFSGGTQVSGQTIYLPRIGTSGVQSRTTKSWKRNWIKRSSVPPPTTPATTSTSTTLTPLNTTRGSSLHS